MQTKEIVYKLTVLLLLIFLLVWIYVIAPYFKKLPADFHYNANILSLDNFYDENSNKFQGEHISKTIFSYQAAGKASNDLIIKNSFFVSSLSGKNIFTVSRLYTINPYTWKHVTEKDGRIGYLFGPRYANKKDFVYWHVNYNAPAVMHYVESEFIHRMLVYHYQAHYMADQTENLAYLPNVPETRGISVNVLLDLWIEPISGWMVKYQDNSLANYYDNKTGKVTAPWNKFSNQYTQTSIDEQVENASKLKLHIIFCDFLVPILIIFLGIIFWTQKPGTTPWAQSLFKIGRVLSSYSLIILYVLLVMILLLLAYHLLWQKKPVENYTVGISIWNNSEAFLETIQGFKNKLAELGFIEGKNIKYIIKFPNANIENQISIIQDFVDRNVNLIFTLATPGTLIAKGITNTIPILFAEVAYPEESNLVTSLMHSANNLVGIRNYIPAAMQIYYFAQLYPNLHDLVFVHQKNDPDSELRYHEYKNVLENRNIAVTEIAAIDIDDLQMKLQNQSANAIFLSCDSLMQSGGDTLIVNYALKHKIPVFTCSKQTLIAGALIAYFPDHYTQGVLAAQKASLLLKGAEPDWLSTESPKKGYLMINKHTADVLQLKIPQVLLEQAGS